MASLPEPSVVRDENVGFALQRLVYRWAANRGRPLYASTVPPREAPKPRMSAALKRKATAKPSKPAAKKSKITSKATVSDDEDEPSVIVAAAAAADLVSSGPRPGSPVKPAKKASTLAQGIAMLNESDASRAGGKVRSLWADAKQNPEVKLMGTTDPFVGIMLNGGANVMPAPMQGKQGEAVFDIPAFPIKFSMLDPARAVAQNNRPDAQYPKTNAADVAATVTIDLEALKSDPTYADSVPGVELLCRYCSDSVVEPSTVMVFPQDHIDKHRAAALSGDESARAKFVEAAQIWANQRGAPFLPCKVMQDGEPRSGTFKMTTKFWGYADPKLKGTGAHQKSIELARRLGGDNMDELIEVMEKPENHGRELRLVDLYDENNVKVPPEDYRKTVAELRDGAVTARVVIKVGAKVLSPKERSVHVAAYIQRLMIVKRGDVQDHPTPGGGIASFLG